MVAPDREITDWRATWVHCSSSASNIYLCAALLTFSFFKSLVDFSAAPHARHGARTREQYPSECLVLERLTERGMNTYRANYFIAWFYVSDVLFLTVIHSCWRQRCKVAVPKDRLSRYIRTIHKGCRHRRASSEEYQRAAHRRNECRPRTSSR